MKYFVLTLIALFQNISFAASCCGGGFSIPGLILGDDKAQLTNTLSSSNVSDEVMSSGKWLQRQDDNRTHTYKIEGAVLIKNSWQSGFSLPVIQKKSAATPASSGAGDLSLYVGHESFPELQYSRWKPKGVTFLQLTLPTSPSIFDAEQGDSTNIRGKGFYTLGAGIALQKNWKVWDINFNTEVHRSFARQITSPIYNGSVELNPGWGLSQNWGLGWNYRELRIGSFISFMYEDPIEVRGATNSRSAFQRVYTLGFSGSYMLTGESAMTLSYSDQALIGDPSNSSLSKTINLSYQHRWPL